MAEVAEFPELDCTLAFKYRDGEFFMTMECERNGKDYCIRVHRNNSRWRYDGGAYVSPHELASIMFKYPVNPPEIMCEHMGQFINEIGKVLDIAAKAVVDGCKSRLETARQAEAFVVAYSQRARMERQSRKALAKGRTKLYLMRHQNGLTKIGRSSNPIARERTLQAEDPRLRMIFCRKVASNVESRLHGIFKDRRVRGEWFALEQRHVEWIVFMLGGISGRKRKNKLPHF